MRTADFEHHENAHRLVARRYADRGYLGNAQSMPAEEALIICSAFEGQTTIGTIAVRFESARGLNADAIFGSELAEMRAAGLRLCEFGRLAVDHEISSKQMLARLFHLAYLHAHRLAGCEQVVIEVNPRHVAFYRRMLGFQVCSEPRLNLRVNAPAVLMSLDLQWAREQIACFGGNPELAGQTRTLYPYFYGTGDEAAMLAKLRQ
ncbi:MAG: long-chain N-acyl amino acid synthase [Burkholderiaceae bacterium]